MKVQIKDTTYFVDWSHHNFSQPKGFLIKSGISIPRFSSTDCFIRVNPDTQFLCKGQAILSEKDNYNRNKGRKISLQKALKFSSFTKEEKADFWLAYFAMGKHW